MKNTQTAESKKVIERMTSKETIEKNYLEIITALKTDRIRKIILGKWLKESEEKLEHFREVVKATKIEVEVLKDLLFTF